MPLAPCKECGREVALSAPTCPNYGVPFPGTTKGKLIIYRRAGFAGSFQQLRIFLNDKEISSLKSGESLNVELLDGKYYLYAAFPNTASKKIEVNIQAGNIIKIEFWFEQKVFDGGIKFQYIR